MSNPTHLASPAPPLSQRQLVALAAAGMLATAAANGIDRFAYTPILPSMMAEMPLTASQAGLIASANFTGYLLGALFASLTRRAIITPQWMVAALGLSALCSALMAFGPSPVVCMLIRFCGGFCGAMAIVISIALVMDQLTTAGRGAWGSVVFGGVGAGIALSGAIVSVLLTLNALWTTLWLGIAVVSMFATGLAAWLIFRLPIAARPAPAVNSPAPSPLKNPRLQQLLVANTLAAFGYVVTGTFLVTLVRASPTLAPVERGIWILFGLAALPSVALWMALAKRAGAFSTFAIICLFEAAGVAASVLWNHPAGVILAAVMVGGSFMGTTALGMMAAREIIAGSMRQPAAWMTASFGIGQVIGPVFAGVVRDATGSYLIPSLTAAAALLLGAEFARRASRPRVSPVTPAHAQT